MAENRPKDFQVAVVGAGMCGIAAAYALTARAGVSVTLFESAPRLGEVGAGVGLGPNALRALDGLGLLEVVRARCGEPEVFRALKYTSGLGNHEVVYDYPPLKPTDAGMGIYRPLFIEAVESLLDPAIIHLNKRCESIEFSGDDVLVHFTDGSFHRADLVIGADGIKSVVRNTVASDEQSRATFMNTVAYRGLVNNADLVKDGVYIDYTGRPICFVGMDRHLIIFPIKSGKVINVVAFDAQHDIPKGSEEIPSSHWVQPASKEELLTKFEGWGHDVQIILSHLKNPNKWYIHGLMPPLNSYVQKQVVLVGDAAHGMEPHLGAGVGQGFEDVFVLYKLLEHPKTTKANLVDVLQVYNSIRPIRANMVLQRSILAGEIYDSYGKYTKDEMQQHLDGLFSPVWHHDLEKEVDEAMKLSKLF